MAKKELSDKKRILILKKSQQKIANKILKHESKYAKIHGKCVAVAEKGRKAFFRDEKISINNFMGYPWNSVEEVGIGMAILATPIVPFTFLAGVIAKMALAIPTEIMYHKYKGKDKYDAGYDKKFRNKFNKKRIALTEKYDKVLAELSERENSLESEKNQVAEIQEQSETYKFEMQTNNQVELTKKPSQLSKNNNKETEMAE